MKNEYEIKYSSLIAEAKVQDRKRLKRTDPNFIYYEEHHIIPLCENGPDTKENKILLTAKEHFLAHYYLCRALEGKKGFGPACFALHSMGFKKSKWNDRNYCEKDFPKEYSYLREKTAEFSSLNQKGKKKSLEHNKKVSLGLLEYYKNNSDSEETRLKKSVSHLGKKMNLSEQERKNRSERGKRSFIGHIFTDEERKRRSEGQKRRCANETPEQKEKRRQSVIQYNKTRILSEETLKKMSLSANRKRVRCIELNKEFNSIKEASKELNIDKGAIANAIRNKYENNGSGFSCGYHWEKIN